MKTLDLNQMENVCASWSWSNCGAGAAAGMMAAISSGSLLFGVFGGAATLIAGAGGCLAANW